MTQGFYKIASNRPLTPTIMEMQLDGDTSALKKPGQFVNIKLDGLYLRRPISVCDRDENSITLIYKIVGDGTERMAKMQAGERLDLLCGLGNGFDTSPSGDAPLLIGGGVGVPPLYGLCKQLISEEKAPTVIMGFNTADEIFYEDKFTALGAKVIVTTADGSKGIRGFVTDAMDKAEYSYVYTCGPEPMLKAVYGKSGCSGQYSFEERMGCGFGACMGCSCKTKYGAKRICTDGPVLTKEEIIW